MGYTAHVNGNYDDIPDFALQFNARVFFKFDSDNAETLAQIDLGKCDFSKEIVLVIPLSIPAGTNVRLTINGKTYRTKEFASYTQWNREVIRVPLNEEKPNKTLSIQISGKPESIIALGDIEIYQ